MSRVKQTLEGFETVAKVEFQSEKEQFEITYRFNQPMGDEFRKAVSDVVIFPGVRKFLGNVGNSLNNSFDQGP